MNLSRMAAAHRCHRRRVESVYTSETCPGTPGGKD